MTTPEEPFSLDIYNSLPPGIVKFLYLPTEVRGKVISECLVRAREDADYFLSEGKTINDFVPGTVLPSGNTVILDEKGRNLVRAPMQDFLKRQ